MGSRTDPNLPWPVDSATGLKFDPATGKLYNPISGAWEFPDKLSQPPVIDPVPPAPQPGPGPFPSGDSQKPGEGNVPAGQGTAPNLSWLPDANKKAMVIAYLEKCAAEGKLPDPHAIAAMMTTPEVTPITAPQAAAEGVFGAQGYTGPTQPVTANVEPPKPDGATQQARKLIAYLYDDHTWSEA